VTDVTAVVEDPNRLAALRRLVLLDSPPSPAFDRLVRLAARVLQSPVAMVTLIDRDRQFFKAAVGLPEPLATQRETPLAMSICQYVVAGGRPLLVDDAREDPLLAGHPVVREFGVVAYGGAPIFTVEGHAVGSVCVLDVVPRHWTAADQENLEDLAAIAAREARHHLQERLEAHRREWRGVRRSGGPRL
jgi:GAF domain-containing protein